MPEEIREKKGPRALLGPRNLAVLAAAVLSVGAGYLLLQAGSTSAAAVLLVVGYCVLFPVAIAL
ncbi:MAG TPA: hypothetical protein VMK53_10550 [Gemmatimonadales bacterium]|nr:hypothetical protein [Gemmatimonadales bacterium]